MTDPAVEYSGDPALVIRAPDEWVAPRLKFPVLVHHPATDDGEQRVQVGNVVFGNG